MDISIIIVSYNTKALLKQCLYSVFEQTQDVCFEVIVVDNASHDGSPQMVREEFSNVMLIESPENLGFGRANNLGAQYAKGKYLFLLNSDTILLNNAVKILADFLDNYPKAGICGGNLFDENKKPTLSFTLAPHLSVVGELLYLFIGVWKDRIIGYFNTKTHPIPVKCVMGADFMVRSNVFREVDGFDKDFILYHEELELTNRIKKIGYKSFNVPQAQIIHLGSKSLNPEQKIKWLLHGRSIYYKKTHNRFGILICNSIYLLTVLSRILVFAIIRNKPKVRIWKITLKEYMKIYGK
jgi:GT2 family glycosyltransferase